MAEATLPKVDAGSPPNPPTGTTGTAVHPDGPKPLKRSIGVVGGTLLTLSCLTPASSLFVIVPGMFATQGTGTALTLVIAAVMCVLAAFCYSELGTMVPSAGGEYAMVGTFMGRFAAWIAFIVAGIVVMVVPPIIALGTGEYITSIVSLDETGIKWAGALVMLGATVMGLLDLRANAWVTGIFLALEVVAAALVAFLGFGHTERGASTLIKPEVLTEGGGMSPLTMGVLISGLAVALFALQGFSTAVYLAEEMDQPRRTVSRTVLWTLGLGAAILIIPTIAITLGASDMETLTAGDLPSMIEGWSNSGMATFISLCIALAIINAAIVMVIQNSRVLYASARDRAWPTPVNKAFGTVNRFGAPWVSTLAVGVPGAVLCFVDLTLLGLVTSVAVTLLYLVVAVAALFSRRGHHKHTPAWRMPLWPAVPIVLIGGLLYVMYELAKSDMEPVYYTLGIVAVAAVYYVAYLYPRQQKRWVITLADEGTPKD
ncbi:APC family permease [Yinghuangia soli]|uniref:APC family permease n=1 Tax=Yinghuangia soli TaxID=2908204 RepID=A0AA41U2C3_9ACTN|nr:APC family permease [Yinghuangia soli]MCF2530551.1 APC family permease [Yinghuangia soli]